MDLQLKGRTALVVGSTSGLGLSIARGLSEEGVRVALSGRREGVAKDEASSLADAIGVSLDLTAASSVEAAVRQVNDVFDGIDILVLNAGGPPPGAAGTLTPDDLAEALSPLFLAQVQLVSLVLPRMRAQSWGRIVAVGSSGIQQPIPHLARSNAARAALAGYLKTLAGEVGRDGVTVNVVLPGRIDTNRVASLDETAAKRQGVEPATVRRNSEAAIPLGRYGKPEEFADMAVFLCSPRASYITGTQVRVDGGSIASI